MQNIWALILLSALASNYEALPQTKWSRPIRNLQGQFTRERRQFPFGDWIPLSQSCPTCRLFADPLDVGFRGENIGLIPPRRPTVTRQIHGEGNFFPQDESSILSVPPPPPTITASNGNFQFSSFGPHFNTPLPVPTQKIVPQSQGQQIQFFPQSFLPNQPLVLNGNQQILSGVNGQSTLFTQRQNQQQINNGKLKSFQNSEFKTQKLPENVVLEQNKRPLAPKPFSNKPQPFTQSLQNQQSTFVQQQSFGGQRQHSANFGNNILSPPPAPSNVSQDIVIPGLDKEEIQLLYVPVETLRQKGTPQEQLLTQQPQNIQFHNRPNGSQRPVNNNRPTEQSIVTQPPAGGHFFTQNGNSGSQTDSSFKVTSVQPFSTSVTPSPLFQHLPFQQTPQPFVSVTPSTPTIQPFSTPASVFQKFSSFTPETTLPHLSTVPNTIQFSQSDTDFGTTPKTVFNQGVFGEEIITGKPEFPGFSNQEQRRPLPQQPLQQSFVTQQPIVTQAPQQNGAFKQESQKGVPAPNQLPHGLEQQQIALQKQQENQRLLQEKRQKELEEQKFLELQRKQKEQEEQRLIEQKRQKELEQQRFAQKQRELEEQQLLQQQRQKELEQQRFLQKQKELEEQRLLQQRQKQLEQQRFLQKQKELEEQRLLQQRQKELEQQRYLQKQKELEQQRLLQQRRQKELEEQRFLEEQKRKELEYQRRLQLQKQKELEEKRLLQQLKQKEEEQQRLLRFQQQQKEIEQQKLLQAQQEQHQRLLQQQKLEKQKQDYLKNQQQSQFFQQQQVQKVPQQSFQQVNRHVLPDNDKLNLIPELEKESEADQQLVPHQPPLSVFFKNYNGGEARITDVLRELRSSNTITVLDQYFEKMPKVFVGPAGLIPPTGYGKFDLPYLSNLESNRIDRRIDKLPFFVAPLNFVPPPGYAKIPFPAPHVGSVVVSSESNPAMTLKSIETGFSQPSAEEENISGSYPVVGPELPGLINNLNTVTTTVKPTTYVSTPSLPQTTAQLRNRRPSSSSSLYKSQNRKPITRTRSTTTSKPEEEVRQSTQKPKVEDSEGIRKPFNRFLHRRRQQTKTTTETPVKSQADSKNIENRFYSVEVYHQDKNQVPGTQYKGEVIQGSQPEDQLNKHIEQSTGSIDRITPESHGVFEVHPTSDYSKTLKNGESVESEEHHQDNSDYSDINLQTFEDGPLPTGSAKTITQELYQPNAISQPQGENNYKALPQPDTTFTSDKFNPASYEDITATKLASDVSPTASADKTSVGEEQSSVLPTSVAAPEKQNESSERSDFNYPPPSEAAFTLSPVTISTDYQTKGFLDSNEQYTSAFAEISKHHHIPGYTDSSKKYPSTFSNAYPTPEISVDLQAPSVDFGNSGVITPTENAAEFSNEKSLPVGTSAELLQPSIEGTSQKQHSDTFSGEVSPTVSASTEGHYTADFPVNLQAQNSEELKKPSFDERIPSFIGVHDNPSFENSSENPQKYFLTSTPQGLITDNSPIVVDNSPLPSTTEALPEIAVNPSTQTYISGSIRDESAHRNEKTHVTEGHGQDISDDLPNDHRLKLPNPSIVRVRTRNRGKPRGQVNFAASQSTTSASYTRSQVDNRYENVEQEFTTKTNHFREYHPIKTSKYNQFRGVKKPVRTTTEPTTESEQKANVYTIRPQRRPLSPSTVSTKRIRRPTTPLPSVEAATEAFGISTGGSYSQPEQSDHSYFSPSGVSNDVYYEQSSLSPVKNKFRKHFGSAEQKKDVVTEYSSTAPPPTFPTYSSTAYDGSSEEYNIVKELALTPAPNEFLDKYPEWNPSESGFDVSGIVLTTNRTPNQDGSLQVEDEEPKKFQDSKKAFDPDLEKKTGRRRVRVRVHKRPHENFETAESQNLRTVANVLVPPTTTYKPSDESGIHQLAKNADFSFGGQKLFGARSREYFKKRLNLTELEGTNKGEQSNGEVGAASESTATVKPLGLFRKTQKNEFEATSAESSESTEGSKNVRPKFRGFVKKIIKHGGPIKNKELEPNQLVENEESEGKHSSQTFRVNQGSFNHTGRVNGTKHKTFVRYVKKNKIRPHENESNVESGFQELRKQDELLHQTTASNSYISESHQTPTEESVASEVNNEEEIQPQSHAVRQEENTSTQQSKTIEESEVKQTEQPSTAIAPESKTTELSSVQTHEESTTPQTSPTTPLTHQGGSYFTQRPKFFQTLRPVFQRSSQSGLYRTKEPEVTSTTTEQTQRTQDTEERRNGYSRFKYGKTTTFATATEKTEESKQINEQQQKNKNLHTLEVRKYLRTKNREGAFSQFSRSKFFKSEKSESETTKELSTEKEPEEITTERNIEISETESTSAEPKTTQPIARTDSFETTAETTKTDDELVATTTEAIASSEVSSQEESEEEITSSANFETTTEAQVPTTVFRPSSTQTAPVKVTTESSEAESVTPEMQTTEIQPDIYRFSKDSFSFDETEKFTGTKNRAHVRNITTDIIENTASFSAPGVEKRPDIRVVTHRADEILQGATATLREKTEETTTEFSPSETTTDYPETETTAAAEAITKAKVAKILKTSTTTKISHETEICYKGKCIRTKSDNPDDDLKLLVDSASTMRIQKRKT